MFRFRFLTSLLLAIFVLLTISYFCYPRSNSQDYTAHWMRDDEQMLMADGGGSKVRYIKSHSAGQYDVTGWKHVQQEYEGPTRQQYEDDELAGKHIFEQTGQPGNVGSKHLADHGAQQQAEAETEASGGKSGNIDSVSEVSQLAREKLRENVPQMLDLWGSLRRGKEGKRRRR